MRLDGTSTPGGSADSFVLYCIIRRSAKDKGPIEFLLMEKQGYLTFPPTKFRPGEDLYQALVRPMGEDLGLPQDSYFPERELGSIPNQDTSPRYPGLPKAWYLYPVDVSLVSDSWKRLNECKTATWLTIEEILETAQEPNVRAIAEFLKKHQPELLQEVHPGPTMDALAAHWGAKNRQGIRILREGEMRRILDAGSRAFNLRVADPYLPYQKQGLGFTWSFFTPKDKQDLHVHGMPAVEIYGIFEGRFLLWHKPMNERGVRRWRYDVLESGDWVEIEPLHCHFGCWLEPKGFGVVVKAAASGELAGVGKVGIAGKTVCEYCNVHEQCTLHPLMVELRDEYSKPYQERDYSRIGRLSNKLLG
jgi:hypothetical protein